MTSDNEPPPQLDENTGWETNEAGASRRALLTSAAGLAMVPFIGSEVALAQHSQGSHQSPMAGRRPSGSLSRRAYSLPTITPGDIAHDPAAVPPPIGKRSPATIRVDLETTEIEGRLDSRTTFQFWTFNNTVPGPLVRARVGDTVEVHLRNHANSSMLHNVDFHAAHGPGGGAEATTAAPGEAKAFRFKAISPGLFVYHCAVPPVAMHVANGMYGMILVEPDSDLPPVDHEFYVMQGEIYTTEPFGSPGLLTTDYEKLLNERPEYFVLNGHVGALTEHYPMKAKVGETIRIYFGNGGPNYVSSFHVIGEVFERVWTNGALIDKPQQHVQTVTVPAGGAVVADIKFVVPGRYVLVDHSLSRVERGLAGWIDVEGPENPEVFSHIG